MRSKILTKLMTMTLCAAYVALLMTPSVMAQQGRQGNAARQTAWLTKEVRHELMTLPNYSVFDWLEFEVRPDSTVILRGAVTKPTIKSSAEANVKDIEGVRVVNQIKVLPLSPN